MESLNAKYLSEANQTILAVLNAGHRRGATVPRCDGAAHQLHYFQVYGPKVFAVIGLLPDTLADRSIVIPMQRKTEDQKVERYLTSRAREQASPIRSRMEVLSKELVQAITAAYREMPDLVFLHDRDADLWMALFAVAAVLDPSRVGDLKQSAVVLSGQKSEGDVDESLALRLLNDIRSVLEPAEIRIRTSEMLHRLSRLEEAPWGSEQVLNAHKLSGLLRQFGIRPRQLRFEENKIARGYMRQALSFAFARYLPPETTAQVDE